MDLSPFLCKGIILATFHFLGTIPCVIDLLIKYVIDRIMLSLDIFKIFTDIPSKPADFLFFICSISFRMSLSLTVENFKGNFTRVVFVSVAVCVPKFR